jgi:acyl-CoA reductase-like NAD-dependent aldehyde dehydrogenase
MSAELKPLPPYRYRLLIGGELVEGHSTLNVLNPATEAIIVAAPRADLRQLEQAVAAAKSATTRCVRSWLC